MGGILWCIENQGNSLTQAKWRLGDGTNIPIDHFVWPSFRAENRGIEAKQLTLVAGLMDKTSGRWNQWLVLSLYDNLCQTLFRRSLTQCLDSRIELSGLTLKSGSYEVRTGFRLFSNNQLINDSALGPHELDSIVWDRLWKLKIWYKIIVLLWIILVNALPVRTEFTRRGTAVTHSCPQCMTGEDTLLSCFHHISFGSGCSLVLN